MKFWRVVFFAGLALLAIFHRGLAAEPVPEVKVALTVLELRMEKEETDSYFARFRISFEWDAAEVADFDPGKLVFQNAEGEPRRMELAPKLAAAASPTMRSESFAVSCVFKGYFDFQDYPFDVHDMPIIFLDSRATQGSYRFVCPAQGIVREPPYYAQFGGWKIASISFYDSDASYIRPLPANEFGQPPVLGGFLMDVRREAVASSVRLIIPLTIIWLMSYMGLFWDDSSPASRCGTAAIFAAIAFAIGSNQIMPLVNYLTVMNVVFLGTYVNIGICFFLVTWMFWLKMRKSFSAARRVWLAGVIVCPLIALATILFSATLSGTRGEPKSFVGEPVSQVKFAGR